MLVLSRKMGQGLRLGDDVRITVLKADHNTVRIGIEPPDGISIRREEIVVSASSSPQPQSRHAGSGVA